MDEKKIGGILFSQHAIEMLKERNIQELWVVKTLGEPDRTENDSEGNTHYIKLIPEYGGRFL